MVKVTRKRLFCGGFLLFIVIAIVITVFAIRKSSVEHLYLVGEPVEKTFKDWATALDEPQCSEISGEIYKKGGTVADAAVASLLCLGVVLPESLGIGGGFFAVYFQKSTGKVLFLDARETAPMAATKDMFANDTIGSSIGARAVAVPGELKGYRELLKMVGTNVSQNQLFEASIKIARDGFKVGEHLAEAMHSKRKLLNESAETREVYFDPKTNKTWRQGDIMKNEKLAATLEMLSKSDDFVKEFYEGDLGRRIVETLKASGGIITMDDLKNYKPITENASHSRMHEKYDVYSTSLPGSGPVLSMMINVLDAFDTTKFPQDYLTYHRLVETMKFAYAKRTWLGDVESAEIQMLVEKMESEDYAEEISKKIENNGTLPIEAYGGALVEPRDHGTSHASFYAPNGDVLAVTSTVNFYFGSGVQIDGIIMNNEMDDFSSPNEYNGFGLPPAKNNFIQPNKRPMSSMAPAIIVKDNEAKLVLGGAGGSQITSAMAEVIMHYVYQGYPLGTAIAHSRVHHQYLPNQILYERECNPEIIKKLESLGHKVVQREPTKRGSVIVGIAREGDHLVAAIDPRKGGGVSGGPL